MVFACDLYGNCVHMNVIVMVFMYEVLYISMYTHAKEVVIHIKRYIKYHIKDSSRHFSNEINFLLVCVLK